MLTLLLVKGVCDDEFGTSENTELAVCIGH